MVKGVNSSPKRELLDIPIQRLFPFLSVVGTVSDAPKVRDVHGLRLGMQFLIDVQEAVALAAGKEKHVERVRGSGIGQAVPDLFRVGAGGEGAEPAKKIEMREADVHRPPAARGETGKGAVITVAVRAVA